MSDTVRDIALGALGRGPTTVGMLVGSLLSHGYGYPEADRKAKEALAALVVEKRAEVVVAQGTTIYRVSATTPIEKTKDD